MGSAEAAEAALSGAAQDPILGSALWLLTQIPLAARGPDYAKDLEALGLHLSDHPTLFDLTSAISDAIDDRARTTGGRTDLGEMAQLALIESPGLWKVVTEGRRKCLESMWPRSEL
jgi:hypothetical protein